MRTTTNAIALGAARALAVATLFVLGRWPVNQMWGAVVFLMAIFSFAGWLVGLRAEGRRPGRVPAAGLLAAAVADIIATFVVSKRTSESVTVYEAVPATSATGIILLVISAAVIGLVRPGRQVKTRPTLLVLGAVLGLAVAAVAVPAGDLLVRPETWTVAEHERSKVADGPVSQPSPEPGDYSGPKAPLDARGSTYGQDAVPIPGTDVIVTYQFDTVRAVEQNDLNVERWRHEYLPADGSAIDALAVDVEGRRVVVLTAGVAVLLDAVTGQELHVFPLPETAHGWRLAAATRPGPSSGLVVTGHMVLMQANGGTRVLALDTLAGHGPVDHAELPGGNCQYQQVFAPKEHSAGTLALLAGEGCGQPRIEFLGAGERYSVEVPDVTDGSVAIVGVHGDYVLLRTGITAGWPYGGEGEVIALTLTPSVAWRVPVAERTKVTVLGATGRVVLETVPLTDNEPRQPATVLDLITGDTVVRAVLPGYPALSYSLPIDGRWWYRFQPEKATASHLDISHIILVDTSTLREVPVGATGAVNNVVASNLVSSIAAADGRLIVTSGGGDVTNFASS